MTLRLEKLAAGFRAGCCLDSQGRGPRAQVPTQLLESTHSVVHIVQKSCHLNILARTSGHDPALTSATPRSSQTGHDVAYRTSQTNTACGTWPGPSSPTALLDQACADRPTDPTACVPQVQMDNAHKTHSCSLSATFPHPCPSFFSPTRQDSTRVRSVADTGYL